MVAGADDFVRKPYKPKEVFDCMAKYLNVRYLYEQEEEKAEEHRVITRITPKMLAGLLTELQSAARAHDLEQTNTVQDCLSGTDLELTNALRRLVQEMDFRTLKSLLDLTRKQG